MEVCWFGPQPRRFAEPLACIEAHDLAGVLPALARADAALAQGYSIAGYLTYDVGEAFVAPSRDGTRVPGTEGTSGIATGARMPILALGIYRPQTNGDRATAFENVAHVDVPPTIGTLVAQIDAARYAQDLDAVARALRAGDVYQVNYTVPFAFAFSGDPRALFDRIRERASVPYAAFVRHGEHALLSLSPERFFHIDGDRLQTRPMKGTSAPAASAQLGSRKNRAEHVMIVDLLRNDMHRVCERVDVDPLFAVETYPTFATMTSTLEGHLREDVRLRDIFTALFPCGSITGAPKGSAMRAIAERERTPRGIAMGTIGYCDGPRHGSWNVAIRTASLDTQTGRGEVRIGGGIVADSTPAAEWAEILVKRRVFADRAPRVGLIETLRIDADGTIASEAAHRERLARSAFALGISHDDALVLRALRARRRIARDSAALVRLELDADGRLEVTERPLVDAPPHPTICISAARVRANDPALRHKTTARSAYDEASDDARARDCFDALLLNERGDVADGSRTSLFVEGEDGGLLTPPLASGALAGILRAELLVTGRARERTLSPNDLAGRRLYLGNAARGLICVTLT